MNLFTNQDFVPMLLNEIKKPFNDPDYIFELKFDGIRTLLFAEPKKITIRNKRGNILNNRYPELLNITKMVTKKVIFDGEIIIMINGKPSFDKLQERALLKNKLKIKYFAKTFPVIFIAYDILYEDKDLTHLPLIKRKKILNKYHNTENFIKSECFDEKGKDLYKLVVKENLEGIVAKKKDSKYYINKRTKNWIKIKNLKDEDFYICGYKEENDKAMASLLLGKKKKKNLIYAGTVNIGRKNSEFQFIKKIPINKNPSFTKEGYINLIPNVKCTILFMEKTKKGFMRQPIYKKLSN
ncbi:MAG: DNA ligase [Bacilli bacterium]|nr:DNA ligase [Bacilli bacterium]